jgi:hypothetical protein
MEGISAEAIWQGLSFFDRAWFRDSIRAGV